MDFKQSPSFYMHWWLFCINIATTFLLIGAQIPTSTEASASSLSKRKWISVFSNNKKWFGSYKYNGELFHCRLSATSLTLGLMYASFTDKDTDLEFEGYSMDGKTVVLRKSITFRATSERILPSRDFEVTGMLVPKDKSKWMYRGNVTLPDPNNFTDFELHSYLDGTGLKKNSSGNGQIALTASITVVSALCGIAIMAWAFIWGVKKGWIRHVPFKYKTFKNPQANYNAEEGHVHI